MLKTREEIQKWLHQSGYTLSDYRIGDDGVVNVICHWDYGGRMETELPFQFGRIEGDFKCDNSRLVNLVGVPHTVDGMFTCSHSHVASLDHVPSRVGGNFCCFDTKIKSLAGISDHVKYVGGVFSCAPIVSHMLGLLLISGIRRIDTGGHPVEAILNRHLVT